MHIHTHIYIYIIHGHGGGLSRSKRKPQHFRVGAHQCRVSSRPFLGGMKKSGRDPMVTSFRVPCRVGGKLLAVAPALLKRMERRCLLVS